MLKRFFRWLGLHVHEWGTWQQVHEFEYVYLVRHAMNYKKIVLRRECACGDFAITTRDIPEGYSE